MARHSFSILAKDSVLPDDWDDRLYRAGCPDALASVVGGRLRIDFDREAPDYDAAVESAMADVRRAGFAVAGVWAGAA